MHIHIHAVQHVSLLKKIVIISIDTNELVCFQTLAKQHVHIKINCTHTHTCEVRNNNVACDNTRKQCALSDKIRQNNTQHSVIGQANFHLHSFCCFVLVSLVINLLKINRKKKQEEFSGKRNENLKTKTDDRCDERVV